MRMLYCMQHLVGVASTCQKVERPWPPQPPHFLRHCVQLVLCTEFLYNFLQSSWGYSNIALLIS